MIFHKRGEVLYFVAIYPKVMDSKKPIQELIKKKAFWEYSSHTHVQTSESGMHTNLYLNTNRIVSDPSLVERIVKDVFAKDLKSKGIRPDWIISYPPFGLPIAYALAKNMQANFGYVDLQTQECNFDIKSGQKVIVIGDDIYSGRSIKKTIDIVSKTGASIVAPIYTIGNFSGTKNISGLEVVSVLSEKGDLYTKKDCPMCAAGSKPLLPRTNWPLLMGKE